MENLGQKRFLTHPTRGCELLGPEKLLVVVSGVDLTVQLEYFHLRAGFFGLKTLKSKSKLIVRPFFFGKIEPESQQSLFPSCGLYRPLNAFAAIATLRRCEFQHSSFVDANHALFVMF